MREAAIVLEVFAWAFLLGYRPSVDAEDLALAFVIVSVFSPNCVVFDLTTATTIRSRGAETDISFLFVMHRCYWTPSILWTRRW